VEMSVSVSEGSGCCCIEAETEEIKVGMVLENLEREKIDALRNRDNILLLFFFKQKLKN